MANLQNGSFKEANNHQKHEQAHHQNAPTNKACKDKPKAPEINSNQEKQHPNKNKNVALAKVGPCVSFGRNQSETSISQPGCPKSFKNLINPKKA